MAQALGKPVAGVSSLAVLSLQALKAGEKGIAVIDAGRGEIYTALYMRRADTVELLDGPAQTPLGSLPAEWSDAMPIVGDEELLDRICGSDSSTIRGPISAPSPSACAFLAEERLRKGAGDNIHSLVPLYIRRSDAETNKARRKQR
jgi:tRNA threonylcarbamoyladenosine biosynthesis protein TsaB